MINLRELRPGNVVLYKGKEHEVQQVNGRFAILKDVLEQVSATDLYPAPITEKALLKMGFRKTADDTYEKGVFIIKGTDKDGFRTTRIPVN